MKGSLGSVGTEARVVMAFVWIVVFLVSHSSIHLLLACNGIMKLFSNLEME